MSGGTLGTELLPEQGNKNIKYLISSCENRTQNLSHLESLTYTSAPQILHKLIKKSVTKTTQINSKNNLQKKARFNSV